MSGHFLKGFRRGALLTAFAMSATLIAGTSVFAQSLGYAPQSGYIANDTLPPQLAPQSDDGEQLAPQSDDGDMSDAVVPDRLRRAIVDYRSSEAPGTVVIDTANTQLYYVLGGGRAIRYGVGVGREGFTWAGTQTVTRKAEWPDWHPPAEMIARQPYLPRFMAGGPGNPLGARAMYLGSSVYRIHGTNDPSTIGKFVSSGCIRLTNEDVTDLFSRVTVGTKVVVLPKSGAHGLEARGATPGRSASSSRNDRQAMNMTGSSIN